MTNSLDVLQGALQNSKNRTCASIMIPIRKSLLRSLRLRPVRFNSTDASSFEARRIEFASTPEAFYPSIGSTRSNAKLQRVPQFVSIFHDMNFQDLPGRRVDTLYQLEGRVSSIRKAGKALYFVDLIQDGQKVQIYASNRQMKLSSSEFNDLHAIVRAHDYVSCLGYPFKTKVGELSLQLERPMKIVSPCLRSTTLPDKVSDKKIINSDRVMNYLVNPELRERLIVKSVVTQAIRNFLVADNFLEVQTPLLAGAGTGANAEPFYSSLKAVSGHKLQLRVAPELWLKRLVIGGFEKVFEIGPSFRNEGVDATHNPEFTTCEFYRSFTTLSELMDITEKLFQAVYALLKAKSDDVPIVIKPLERLAACESGNFPKYEFIPTIEKATGVPLPDELTSDNLISYFKEIGLQLPDQKQPAALLNSLSEEYLESLTKVHVNTPVFIYNQPAEMSPLAKSTKITYDGRDYEISQRFELFINNMEYVNAYEEENSPFAQENKFKQQQSYKEDFNDNESLIPDWNYVRTMKYGLPPTGGWGCGIDRLSMLFSDSSRIEDVLSFGTIKDVVKQ